MQSLAEKVEIYTDGACRNNPGAGGWSAILRFAEKEEKLCGSESHTTNNRMELTAAIRGLESLQNKEFLVSVYSDSRYLHSGITQWIARWKRNGWRTADKKSVRNDDLWKRLDALNQRHRVSWFWVRGHDGNLFNEEADRLARQAVRRQTHVL